MQTIPQFQPQTEPQPEPPVQPDEITIALWMHHNKYYVGFYFPGVDPDHADCQVYLEYVPDQNQPEKLATLVAEKCSLVDTNLVYLYIWMLGIAEVIRLNIGAFWQDPDHYLAACPPVPDPFVLMIQTPD